MVARRKTSTTTNAADSKKQQQPTYVKPSAFAEADKMIRRLKLENARNDLKRSAKRLGLVAPQTVAISSASDSDSNNDIATTVTKTKKIKK